MNKAKASPFWVYTSPLVREEDLKSMEFKWSDTDFKDYERRVCGGIFTDKGCKWPTVGSRQTSHSSLLRFVLQNRFYLAPEKRNGIPVPLIKTIIESLDFLWFVSCIKTRNELAPLGVKILVL